MMSSGSGELPRLLDILRPCMSRIIPVKYTFLNGMRELIVPGRNSSPAIIIRATQKNMMSGPVTRSVVG